MDFSDLFAHWNLTWIHWFTCPLRAIANLPDDQPSFKRCRTRIMKEWLEQARN